MTEIIMPKELEEIASIQQEEEEDLLKLENVVGVALGNKIRKGQDTAETAVSVLVRHKLPASMLGKKDKIPSKIKGASTDVIEVGDIFAGCAASPALENPQPVQEDDEVSVQTLRGRVRPAMGGFSVGHYRITAGTIGTCCYDASPFPGIPRKYYILSNNHVLANSNQARIGDPILQPGPVDGGTMPRDIIARLSRFVPIRFISGSTVPSNLVDAAIAEGAFEHLNRQIYWIGTVKRLYVAPKVGDIVQKTGRTTNFTTGRVTHVNGTVNVNYGSGQVARFIRQIITTNMSAGGDSGSLVTDRNEGAVGLLFAGSASHTIINNIAYVQSLLGIRVTEI